MKALRLLGLAPIAWVGLAQADWVLSNDDSHLNFVTTKANAAAEVGTFGRLDGQVDGQDFVIWNDHKFSTSLLASEGDFNADGRVDGGDFVLWNIDKFSTLPLNTVPEPAYPLAALVGSVLAALRRSRLATVAEVR